MLAAVRPRDLGTSRSQLFAESTICLRVSRRGAGLDQSCNQLSELAGVIPQRKMSLMAHRVMSPGPIDFVMPGLSRP